MTAIGKKRKFTKANVKHENAGYLIESSKRNFEQEILKSVFNGFDVGEINHSQKFYSNFMPFVSQQVTERLKSFFSSRLDHTGFKPPVRLQADKGKNVHRSRQFTSVLTVVPESPKLLTYIYLGQPVVKSHDGPGVTRSIIDELILGISKEIMWKVEALMDNIFILAFLHILQKLSIFRTNLFVRGILSIREV